MTTTSSAADSAPARVTESVTLRNVSARTAYEAVSNVRNMGRWSPECRGAWVLGQGDTLRPGMRFIGRNRAGWLPWATLCRVVEADPGIRFAFRVSFLGIRLARWSYVFADTPDGCEVTQEWLDCRKGPAAAVLVAATPLVTGVVRRVRRNRSTMRTTLAALRDDLEGGTWS